MPSSTLGTMASGGSGRYSEAVLGQELRRQAEAAERAARMNTPNTNTMGSALRAKLNSLGRKYNKYTMGTRNPRGMRFVKRR